MQYNIVLIFVPLSEMFSENVHLFSKKCFLLPYIYLADSMISLRVSLFLREMQNITLISQLT